ncbi:MAG: PIG-L family deacetylase [Anaerolineae bacterium]|nr:PIG-L family deacetylase [Anaerolineae bacterium]
MPQKERVLLSVLAHPDDESFGMGGTLALYAQQGVKVHLICATRGEAGEVGPEYLQDYDSIAELRESELRCAAAHLGLQQVHILDYRDSGMIGSEDNNHPDALMNAPLEQVAVQVAHYIRELKPQVVLTFDPIGGYRHPDHIHIQKATTRAFNLAANPDFENGLPPYHPKKFYYHTISRRFLRLAVGILKILRKDPSRWGKNGDIDLVSLAVEDFPIHARIEFRPVEPRKVAASACHASQGGGSAISSPIQWIFKLFMGRPHDTFMRVFPVPEANRIETDLFEGIE